jgi:hypothetical protein
MGVKNNKKFQFDKTIYADKYLLKNLKLNDKDDDNKVSELKSKASDLRDQISKLSNHHKGMGIDEILEVTLNFVKTRTEPGSDFENIFFSPDSKSPQVKSDSSTTHVISELRHIQDTVRLELASLEAKLKIVE